LAKYAPCKKPQRASPEEVHIERDGEYAVITFADNTVGGMNLKQPGSSTDD
jgi:hypothetical protein